MPKNPLKQFARRRSSGNPLDLVFNGAEPLPSPPSFRVLDSSTYRNTVDSPDAFIDRQPLTRQLHLPLLDLQGHLIEELGPRVDRGSGQTSTSQSGSSAPCSSYAASQRYSSASSTIPSSVDADREQDAENESRPAHEQVVRQSVLDAHLPPPSFTERAATGLLAATHRGTMEQSSEGAQPPTPLSSSPHRERATTASSYASTAKPELPFTLPATDFSDEFSPFFESAPKPPLHSAPMQPPSPVREKHRTDSPPIFPPRSHLRQPSSPIRFAADGPASPYSFDGDNADDALLPNASCISPRSERMSISKHSLGQAHGGRSTPRGLGDTPLLRREYSPERVTSLQQAAGTTPQGLGLDYSGLIDKSGDGWVRRVELCDPPKRVSRGSFEEADQTKSDFVIPGAVSLRKEQVPNAVAAELTGSHSPSGPDLRDQPTPRNASAQRTGQQYLLRNDHDSLFDITPIRPHSAATASEQAQPRSNIDNRKRMTKAEFDQLQRYDHRSDDDESEHDDYDDDGIERARHLAKQRQKQEANLSIYRQQMKKVTGGELLGTPPRPVLDRSSQSAPSLTSFHLGGTGGSLAPSPVQRASDGDDHDDVPLGILQAHGFPSSSRPPTSLEDEVARSQRRASAVPSITVNSTSNQAGLPPFARGLPTDPYFGASVVSPSQRESIGLGTMGSSVYGAAQSPPQMRHPGGLVGIIAGEERARAARRGSPNPITGGFGPQGLPSSVPYSMGDSVPNLGARTMSMISLPASHPMAVQAPAMQSVEQMQQFMAMQMQMMQNMQNMLAMQQQLGMAPQSLGQQYAGAATPASTQVRARSMMTLHTEQLHSEQNHRPLSILPTGSASTPNLTVNRTTTAYAPSIAPSERSNIGMPTRYRPVSITPDTESHSQALPHPSPNSAPLRDPVNCASMSSQPSRSTIRLVDRPKAAPRAPSAGQITSARADEDEDVAAWAEMRRQRDERLRRAKLARAAASPVLEGPPLAALYQAVD